MANVLIAGCGYVGTALGQHLAKAGHMVWGLRRETGDLPSPILTLNADLTDYESLRSIPINLDTVFYTASPDSSDEAGYCAAYIDGLRNLLDELKTRGEKPRVLYTSSTAVYAQQSGEWVDESSPTTPDYFSGRYLLEGEQYLLNSGFQAVIVRLGGIYGPGRTRLIRKIKEGNATYLDGSLRYINHIHRDDCVGALAHLMVQEQPDSMYLGVDHEPIERHELLSWLAKELGTPLSQVVLSSQAGSRQTGNNKRCRNMQLLSSGYVFCYPTYREGYAAIFASGMC